LVLVRRQPTPPPAGHPTSPNTTSATPPPPPAPAPPAARPGPPAPAASQAGALDARPLAELVGEVDFPLCLPIGRAFVGRVERRPEGAVVIAFPARNSGELLTVSQSAGAGIADTAGWERVRLPDGTPASWWPPDGDLLQGHLVFDRAGTRVWVRGVNRHAMTALALSLHPARRP
ncbi:hypothetical protein I6A84_16990, partial [Frankia sp. CNm7]|uniref:hypothetical protein n=1 Tax=Frankia nepalensis TaxID=1836974 RepID=UPI001933A8FA